MIPIVRTKSQRIAWSASFFWFKRVYVGLPFHDLPMLVRTAILHHERAHCDGHHTEQRILALLFPPMLRWLCHRQEYAADCAAVSAGYGKEMSWLLRHSTDSGILYPSNAQRRHKMLHNELFERSTTRINRTVGVTD